MNVKSLFATALVLAAFASPAAAANSAQTTTTLNLRAGPSTHYPVVTTIPTSSSVVLYGCNANVTWCDTAFGRHRGWASAKYIKVASGGSVVVVSRAVVRTVGVPVVTYNRVYWDTYYASYPWYGRWSTYHRTGTAAAGCVGRACGARQTATGPYGGSAARAGGCYNGVCAGTKKVTGPNGRTYRKSGGCNAHTGNCKVRRTGPAGTSVTRHRRIR